MRRMATWIPFLLLLVGSAARAEEPAASRDGSPPAAAPASPTPPAPASVTPRIRASHRVEVIAPGERVETVVNRMRAAIAPDAYDGRARDAMQPQATDRRGDRGGDAVHPGTATGASGGSMPGMGPGPSTSGSGPGPAPDHHRRDR